MACEIFETLDMNRMVMFLKSFYCLESTSLQDYLFQWSPCNTHENMVFYQSIYSQKWIQATPSFKMMKQLDLVLIFQESGKNLAPICL